MNVFSHKRNTNIRINQFLIDEYDKHSSRESFWSAWINFTQSKKILEIGVFKGEFSAHLLSNCSNIKQYYVLDSWRNLTNWNKPCNISDEQFELVYEEMLKNTEFAKKKRIILKGTTIERINNIKNNALDFVYIDGDHTLRGISIDLIKSWEKVKFGGFIAGDDFTANIWQHSNNYEPSLIFPYAVYFAEAMNAEIYSLPNNQFLIIKSQSGFKFHDLVKKHPTTDLLSQIQKFK